MRPSICVVTSTRADYGLLRQLLFRLKASAQVSLTLLVTGTHLSDAFGNTQTEITADGFSYDAVSIPTEDDSKQGMAVTTGIAAVRFAEYFGSHSFDLLVVLGDRFEILSAATAAMLMCIPIAHISGGDVTEGAVDDAVRHCITKMSTLHFPGCEQSRRRIIQMGEHPDTVFNVGEPGVENCLHTAFLTTAELNRSLGVGLFDKPYAVVTFHPVTKEENTAMTQMHALISAMEAFPDLNYLITMANAHAGGRAINNLWREAGAKHSNWLVVSSLGAVRYLSAAKSAALVLGNSSSGIVEAPSLGVPTVNIGDRQKGRMRAQSVIDCEPERSAIVAAIEKALTPEFKAIAGRTESPFGDGTTSEKIITELLAFLNSPLSSMKKQFYDVEFSL